MRGEERSDVALDLLEGFVGVCLGQGVEDMAHLGQKLARALQGFDRIGEGRRLGRGGDGLDLCLLPGHAGLEGGHIVRFLDRIEGGRPEGGCPCCEKGIHFGLRGGRLGFVLLGAEGQAQRQGQDQERRSLHRLRLLCVIRPASLCGSAFFVGIKKIKGYIARSGGFWQQEIGLTSPAGWKC
jgi:hypothetical protein